LTVTYSRGYQRINYLVDGGFEGYTACDDFCFTTSYANWIGTSPPGGTDDASIIYYVPYAHSGHGSSLLGSGLGLDALAGTLTSTNPLQTVAGQSYTIGFFQASSYSGPVDEAPAFVNVLWNGENVLTINPGYTNYKFFSVDVVASGNDVIAFNGGAAPAWSFLDDISVFISN
jgi:hypothetical protein